MKDIDRVSFWHNRHGDRIDLKCGKVFDHKSKSHKKLKFTAKQIRDTDLPVDLTDWCVTVTCVDGTVMHSEVYNTLETGSHVKYLIHNPIGSLLDDNTAVFNP